MPFTRRTIIAGAVAGVAGAPQAVGASISGDLLMPSSERHRLIESRIAAFGIELGHSKPGGAYGSVVEDYGIIQVSGMVRSLDGEVVVTGRVEDVTLQQAQYAARICALRCLNALGRHLGDFGRIRRVTRMTVYTQAAPGFVRLSEVSNGASDVINSVLAPFGEHARTSIGAFALPRNATVELGMTVTIERI